MNKPRIAFATLGCKINQVDSAKLENDFIDAGYEVVEWPGPADVCVINTCTVTARADRHSRQKAARARRDNPNALIVVTGCAPIAGGGKENAFDDADLITGNVEKNKLVEIVGQTRRGITERIIGNISCEHAIQSCDAALQIGRIRSFLKVQDGCPAECTYCIVPTVRGPSRSLPLAEAVRIANEMIDLQQKEIVLTGIHLGVYGRDLQPATDLTTLCRAVLAIGIARLRLSSLEPLEVTDDLFDLMMEQPRFCNHLHIPLQSGCDRILRLMNRPYDTATYEQIVAKCRSAVPGITVGADVLVGFPGETQDDFTQTMETLTRLRLSHVHIFPYSDRPGTVASNMPHKVARKEILERAAAVRELCDGFRKQWRKAHIGQKLSILIEQTEDDRHADGKSHNYLPVKVNGDCRVGEEVSVEIVGINEEMELIGQKEN